MRVFILGDFDTGGQGVRIVEAFRDSGWEVRSMVKDGMYMDYPPDLPYRRRTADEFYQWADVIHVRNHFTDYDRMAAAFGPKPVVFHAHGTKFRGDPARWVREARKRKAVILASTLDLWLLAPEDSEWLPSPHDCAWLASISEATRQASAPPSSEPSATTPR